MLKMVLNIFMNILQSNPRKSPPPPSYCHGKGFAAKTPTVVLIIQPFIWTEEGKKYPAP